MKKRLEQSFGSEWWQTFNEMLCYSTEKIYQLKTTLFFE